MAARILLTGGAGYIGSHTYLALVAAGYEVVILDSFANAARNVPDRLAQITGHPVPLVEADVRDQSRLEQLFSAQHFDAVVHFAALKSVGDSCADPLGYMDCNLGGLIALMQAMAGNRVWNLVFSSSAAVYGAAKRLPIPEATPLSAANPYGFTKLVGEQILTQAAEAEPRWRHGVLRYFNPVGAHPSGLIGEDPNGVPANLMPYIADVARGKRDRVQVFGNDYDTPDGTGVRDYIHVMDLARGHVLSLNALLQQGLSHTVNLGTGRGYSVLEMVQAYATACGQDIPYDIAPRRAGDPAASYADVTEARETLGFEAELDLDDMCASSWNWVSRGL